MNGLETTPALHQNGQLLSDVLRPCQSCRLAPVVFSISFILASLVVAQILEPLSMHTFYLSSLLFGADSRKRCVPFERSGGDQDVPKHQDEQPWWRERALAVPYSKVDRMIGNVIELGTW